ncbi:MAG TPA: hypothetical protein DEQ32_00615 [Gammaproteobacteria bacterium]|nr:hypothetical protein [Gammaproteobacteria bacterium]|tara:strand:- start:5077 stop:5334 length:258 start_codon:yes stop_codon:yes gene_type:complete
MKFIFNWFRPNKKLQEDNRLLRLQTEILTAKIDALVMDNELIEAENEVLKLQVANMEKANMMQMKDLLQELDLMALEQMKPVGDA